MKNKALLFASFIFMLFVSCDSSSVDESEPTTNFLSSKLKNLKINEVEKNTPNSSANGQGAIFLNYEGFVPGIQYFSFHANTDVNGVVSGSFETKWGVNGRIHGTIDCLTTLSDGKTAILSGKVTQINGDGYINSGFLVGMNAWFKVQDNGEGANSSTDMFSDIYANFDPILQCSFNLGVDMLTITNGNIQVK
ncbi:hypothetical protein [Flavobacterium sp.]|uniref:hypothetical protein n=1 Tax=Flavobacterium sp. TaxID=239 RepID=UPI00286B8DE7|nr:hypothetical protein [Flavobacterium sp.]